MQFKIDDNENLKGVLEVNNRLDKQTLDKQMV